MKVHVKPMPESYKRFSMKYRPGIPPIFGGEPTDADIELARKLFAALDNESKAWYRHNTRLFQDE